VQNIKQNSFVGFLNFLNHLDQILENHTNSDSVIKCPIKISSVIHEICYYKIQITEEFCIQYIYLLFIYLLLIFCSVSIHSAEGSKYQQFGKRETKLIE